jgi:hypothetical protein
MLEDAGSEALRVARMTPHNADQSNLAAQPCRDDFTTEKIVSSRIMRAEDEAP